MKRNRETGPDLFSLRCEACGRYLVRTESGYMACPMGHGRLQIDKLTPSPSVEADLFPNLENKQ